LEKVALIAETPILWWLLFLAFSVIQGTFFWALFVIGHDCGHGSFSPSTRFNNFIGHISHTFILVPFHSWRLSHHLHHTYHSHVQKDHSYVATTQTKYESMAPAARIYRYTFYLFGGWPLYLLMGMADRDDYHFWPNDALCKNEEEKSQMRESIAWIIGFVGILALIGYYQGLSTLLVYYLPPYIVFSMWISLVTHLHHTHPDVPWFRDPDWSYMRGALSTVDRNYGIVEPIHHDIGTHTVHHLFNKIPHYHLKEATVAIKPILGEYHKKSEDQVLSAMLKIWNHCRYVSDVGSVMFYQSKAKV